jgi:hypothetical protein
VNDSIRSLIAWIVIVVAGLLVIGLIAEARGKKHYRGDEIGSHGTPVVIVHIVP